MNFTEYMALLFTLLAVFVGMLVAWTYTKPGKRWIASL